MFSPLRSLRRIPSVVFTLLACVQAAFAQSLLSGFNRTGAGPYSYDAAGNWSDNAITGHFEQTFDVNVTAQTVAFESSRMAS